MSTYKQSTGVLSRAGQKIATGYSGHGEGLNNPAMQAVPNVGPIPAGRWRFAALAQDNDTGPDSILIWPEAGTQTFGRSGFRCHGDNKAMNHSASHGCIILPHPIRLFIIAAMKAGDDELEVIA